MRGRIGGHVNVGLGGEEHMKRQLRSNAAANDGAIAGDASAHGNAATRA
jgi:hypothetical protein